MPIADFISDLVHKVGYNNEQPKYTAQDSQFGNPQILAQDQGQFDALLGGSRKGGTLSSVAPWDTSPLANVVRESIRQRGPTAVIAPQTSQGLPRQGYANVPMHEGIHQFTGDDVLDTNEFLGKLDPELSSKIKTKLGSMYAQPSVWNLWSGEGFDKEIPARLGSGQISSLGLNRDEAAKVWQLYLSEYKKKFPDKAKTLEEKTKGVKEDNE